MRLTAKGEYDCACHGASGLSLPGRACAFKAIAKVENISFSIWSRSF